MSLHECDCGGIFADLELLARCQEHNHYRGEKPKPEPAEVVELRAQVARSMALATERGQLLSECARLIPIAGPLPDRIRFLLRQPRTIVEGALDYPRIVFEQLAVNRRLIESLECLVHRCEAEGCGTSWAPLADAKNLLKEIK